MKVEGFKNEYHSEYLDLYQMDNMELMKQFPGNHFDLAIVDPPYGLDCFKGDLGKTRFSKHNKKEMLFNNNTPTDEYFKELFRVSKVQIIWGANNFILPPTEYFCIWNKKQTVDNFASAEYAWVGGDIKAPAKVFDYGIHKHNATENKIHPTQKPVKLYKWLLENYAKPGDKILDTHLGSGSIAVACENGIIINNETVKFNLTGCELDEEYFDNMCKRIEAETQQQTLF